MSSPASPELWDIDRIWEALSERFDRETVQYYRRLADSPSEGFEEAREGFRDEVAALAGKSNDINRDEAKKRLILAHLVFSLFDGLRRGETEWRALPPARGGWDQQETDLLLWAAQHGTSDDRWSNARARIFGSEA